MSMAPIAIATPYGTFSPAVSTRGQFCGTRGEAQATSIIRLRLRIRSSRTSPPPASPTHTRNGSKPSIPIHKAAAESSFTSPPPKALSWNMMNPPAKTTMPATMWPTQWTSAPASAAAAANAGKLAAMAAFAQFGIRKVAMSPTASATIAATNSQRAASTTKAGSIPGLLFECGGSGDRPARLQMLHLLQVLVGQLVIGGRGRNGLQEECLGYVQVAAKHRNVADIVQTLREGLALGAAERVLIAPLPGLGDAQVVRRFVEVR